MKRDIFSLGDILSNPEKYSWGAFVYVSSKDEITRSSPAIVIPDFDPDLEKESVSIDGNDDISFVEFLSLDDILQVRDNLINQRKATDISNMVKAVRYYYEFDAFIELPA